MTPRLARAALFAAALFAAFAARAGVSVAPTRLVLENGRSQGEFVLTNPGPETERYRVSLVKRRMSDDGRLVEAPRALPGERFADAMLQYTPRLLVLQPGESQTIRVRVSPRGEFIWGEYRSHLLIERVAEQPPAAPALDAPIPPWRDERSSPAGFTVPIIVRAGSLLSGGELTDLALRVDEGGPRLTLLIQRTGERSLFGDLEVHHDLPDGASRVVGSARGVALYPPNRVRPFSLALDFPDGAVPTSGRLRVEYRDAEPAATGLIAAGTFALTGN